MHSPASILYALSFFMVCFLSLNASNISFLPCSVEYLRIYLSLESFIRCLQASISPTKHYHRYINRIGYRIGPRIIFCCTLYSHWVSYLVFPIKPLHFESCPIIEAVTRIENFRRTRIQGLNGFALCLIRSCKSIALPANPF
jgi:hypothetical protein